VVPPSPYKDALRAEVLTAGRLQRQLPRSEGSTAAAPPLDTAASGCWVLLALLQRHARQLLL
jgi:hypothetical protein